MRFSYATNIWRPIKDSRGPYNDHSLKSKLPGGAELAICRDYKGFADADKGLQKVNLRV